MLANLIRTVFKGKPPPEVKVLSVIASRTEERSLSGVETFLRSVGAPEPFSLEVVGDDAGIFLLAAAERVNTSNSKWAPTTARPDQRGLPGGRPTAPGRRRAGLVHHFNRDQFQSR